MYIANPLGLTALLVLPLIVLLHVVRRRAPLLRVAGVFLWKIATRSTPERPRAGLRSRALACDLATAAAVVTLLCYPRFGPTADDAAGGSWTVVALRVLLAAVALAFAAGAWSESAAERA